MAALSDVRPGLTVAQRVHAAAQREQLKRDLEEQMRERRAAEARRKAELAAVEEREEAQLHAYWASQQQAQQGPAAKPSAAAAPAEPAQEGGRQRGAAARRPPTPVGRSSVLRAGRGAVDEPHGARRGEALVQPGVTVFLPPDKAAERAAHLRARQASESGCSEEAEVVQPRARSGAQAAAAVPAAPWAQQQQGAAAAMAALLAQQQALPFLAPAQAAALLAAAGMPLYPPIGLALPAAPPQSAGSGGVPASSDPQVLALLRELQQEQQRMRDQLAAQLEAVSRLSGDASHARSERDRARQDLERVQRLLAERQGGAALADGFSPVAAGGGGGLLDATSHVLPLGAHRIPSRLGSPAASARGPVPAGVAAAGGAPAAARRAPLPARYHQQTEEPWQARQHQTQGQPQGRPAQRAKWGTKQVAGAAGAPQQARQVQAKPAPAKGWRK